MTEAVIFDVDGTLVDTNYLHAVTWWEAFRQYGHGVDMAAVHRAIGMGSDKLLDQLLPDDRDRDEDDAIRAAHKTLYRLFWKRLRAFDGAADLLRACAALGLKVVLASSAEGDEMEALRAALDADDAITAATSSADAEESKPAPDIVQVALERAGVPADRAIFVGDTVWDVRACQKAGLPCIAVLTGGIGADEVREAGAVAVYDGPAHLLAELDRSPIAE
ncbi:HAD family hydrolase [Actinoallomurus rhizosphaericola]|uniref:HAD family hydrolase n=1 Tax=Actinoallomurus rhizosphaericola TaxID=2952536 RepID=UPI0020910536|nr:HAD family hydrolase [Actinoallomurus rhizosphaericola]MCO5993247.1 HAD family hydrolase [Actinoallomurus rhizosphaericola]